MMFDPDEIVQKLNELDPSDAYHADETLDAESYYAALDRCILIVKGELKDWQDS
jgi:hypothetical protein